MTPHERLERSTWDLFGLPDDITVVDRPELLALHTERHLPYLNCVYRTRAGASRLPALIAEVDDLHVGVRSRWTVPDTIDVEPLEAALTSGGYEPTNVHDARVIATDAFSPRPSGVSVRRVADEETLRDCWHVADSAFGRNGDYTDDDVPVELAQCAATDARVQRFVAYIDDRPVSSGGVNLSPELGFGFLWAGGTVPEARGRGAYSAIVAARIGCAAMRGIPFVGVYARVDSSSPIVAAQGFESVGRMAYWERAPRKG